MKRRAPRAGGFHLLAQVREVRGQLFGRLHLAARTRPGRAPALTFTVGAARRAPAAARTAIGLPAAVGGRLRVARDRRLGEIEQPNREAEPRGEFVEEGSGVAGAPRE